MEFASCPIISQSSQTQSHQYTLLLSLFVESIIIRLPALRAIKLRIRIPKKHRSNSAALRARTWRSGTMFISMFCHI